MALTKQDLSAIQTIVVGTFNSALETLVLPRFDRLENRVDELEGRMGRLEDRMGGLEAQQRETNQRLGALEEKVKNIDTRLKAIENDIKEIYAVIAKLQQSPDEKKFAKLKSEQKILQLYNQILALAKEHGVKLQP